MKPFRIETSAKVRSRTYAGHVELAAKDFGLPNRCWTTDQWKHLETKAKNRPFQRTDIDAYVRVLKILALSDARSVLRLPNQKVERKHVAQLFAAVERELAAATESPTVRTRHSANFRKIVLDTAAIQQLGEEVSRSSVSFRTTFVTRGRPRPLISDFSNLSAPEELRAPVAALAHTNIRDLIGKAEARLRFDLELITSACISELKAWDALRTAISKLGTRRYSIEQLTWGEALIRSQKSIPKDIEPFIATATPEFMLGLYQRLMVRHRLGHLDREFAPTFWNGEKYLRSSFGRNLGFFQGRQGPRLHHLPFRIVSSELVAIFVLLLAYTGWNSMSLLNMTVQDVLFEADCVVVQGYKSKTDDQTPKVYLDSSHPYAREALSRILWNREQLISLGFLDPSNQSLWFTWSAKYDVLRYQYIGFQNELRRFQERHGLPTFSLEQVRAQVLAYQSLKTRDPECVRRIAGHRSLETTGHYLDQLVLYRLNEAMNLEFQRRLENTVKFRLTRSSPNDKILVDGRYVDLRLLTPVGDGGSCSDPSVPPDSTYLVGNVCDARHCHVEGGCPNRIVVVDKPRLRELIRKRLYYLRNWQRLEANSRAVFEAYHVPAILFTLGLYDFVKSSPYRTFLEQEERRIAENEATPRA